jgi:hypothetical protein
MHDIGLDFQSPLREKTAASAPLSAEQLMQLVFQSPGREPDRCKGGVGISKDPITATFNCWRERAATGESRQAGGAVASFNRWSTKRPAARR